MGYLEDIKLNIRESDCPFFSDSDIEAYYVKNGRDAKKTSYECLLVKAQDTTLSVSGLSCGDTSKYFRRLAQMYRPIHSGTLNGGW